jgi:hypothetical protein
MRCIVLPWVYKANKQIDMPAKTKTLQTSTILGPNPSSQFVANSPLCFPQLLLAATRRPPSQFAATANAD